MMKTLDEVIYWYENRKGLLTGLGTRQEMEESLLYHLKEYKKIADVIETAGIFEFLTGIEGNEIILKIVVGKVLENISLN